ncbi:MAG: hypothetical protein VKJ46_06145 [Leptolyngbyaceae bacterium]|nr:hypothetical protein [Leptolyngbyaceae bacterium]
MVRSVTFGVVLKDYLRDAQKAMAYLQSALEENDPQLFLAALRDVAEVQGVLAAPASSMPELSKLLESLRRHGVSDEVITTALAEVNASVEAA